MQEALSQILSYVWGVWRFRWLALIVAWVIALAGWAYVWQMPESYVATARVYVDTNSVLRPLLRGLAITPNIDQRISMLSRTLLSRPNLEKLSRMTDLDLIATTESQKAALIERLRSSISLSGSRANASLYEIAVRDRDRDVARRVTQSLITVFIESSLNEKRADSTGAQAFLDEQIAEYEARLIEAESRLARFKQKNADVVPGSSGDYYSRLQAARSNLATARLELDELQNRRSELQRQLDGEEPVFLGGGSGNAMQNSPLDQRIQTLNVRRDELLARYTDQHPQVRQISGLIDELQAKKQEEMAAMSPGMGSGFGNLNASPVYQGMRAMLAETEARVAELRVRVEEYQRRVDDLNGKVVQIPEVEAQLQQLNRDYEVVSRQHQELLQRRESARLGQDVESNASDVTFRVIDPPYVPLVPNEPNKLLLNVGVVVVALGAGVALALLLALLKPLIADARMLANTTGLPLLGTVTLNSKVHERRSENWRLAGFAACTLLLLVTAAGVAVGPALLA
ncbi:XrtA system polysaccharide chain length determinant [Chromatocurvus halotolerans]|uniref:Polysaccharide chain length determinant protein (PEP-CTERM system associated) n=1 Tax=Chromatocurvus halotolerans TaxID=1132028 RepID=A0A4R2KVR8_9GAMM|nr:XrtA system polysaccharide chain length determinant [Chromatocurvus halotolerans]TCO74328.1 polysaccharide chain length determinant protein (PEP-CTERM system associated) [Chromatocurvus halotolerans]